MSRETVACVTWQPALASASASSNWLPIRFRETTLAIKRCRSDFVSKRLSTRGTVAPRFGRVTVRQRSRHAAEAALDRSLRGPRRRCDDGRPARGVRDLARRHGRSASGEAMTKGDLLVERGANRLQELADRAAARGDGVGEWLSEELRNDAHFLRKLKPSLVKARAKGDVPTNQEPPPAPSGPQLGSRPKAKKERKKGGKGPAPLLVVGAALVAGIVIAKVVDWRGHAHPRD